MRPQMSHERTCPADGEDLNPAQRQEPRPKQRHRPSADARSARHVRGVRLREGAHDKERRASAASPRMR